MHKVPVDLCSIARLRPVPPRPRRPLDFPPGRDRSVGAAAR